MSISSAPASTANLVSVIFISIGACPEGNAVDCHRNWEVLYMRRVPVIKKNAYLEYLLRDYPVLFVNDYVEVTEEYLLSNEHLFDQMQEIDLDNLNIQTFYDKIVNDSIKTDD